MKKLFTCLLFLTFVNTAFSQNQANWKISDYLENLPSEYKTYYGDFSEVKKENTIIDNKNGYAAFLEMPEEPFAIFEMALFKPQSGFPVLVVSNHQSDAVCVFYDTFFLQKNENGWINVKSKILPKITDDLFFKDVQYSKKFAALQKKYGDSIGGLDYHFQPPRNGTKMKVSPVFCDWVDDEIATKADLQDYKNIMKSTKSIYLQWNKNTGKFELTK